MRVFTLGTTEANLAAIRAYEAVGFRCFDARVQLNLAAASG
jgi:RimJ/RimL family protein N-acetyltransferase